MLKTIRQKSKLSSICTILGAVSVMAATSSIGSAAPILFDQDITPDTIFGSGNSNGFFTVDRSNGIELGLRAKVPFVAGVTSNGDGSYSYTLAEANPRWNFDWSVNTDYDSNSPTGAVISDFTYALSIDFDPGIGTDFFTFDPITPSIAVPYFDHSIGTNATANGAGTEAGDAGTYQTLIDNNNVLQQSWRHAFFTAASGKSYDPAIDGTYDIVLSAFEGTALASSTNIRVIIGTGGTRVPEPAPMVLLGLGLLGFGMMRYKKR